MEHIKLTVKEALGKSSLTIQQAEIFGKLGISPTKDKGITISVRVPYHIWCNEEKAKKYNTEAYESIMNHKDLYTFCRLYGYKDLEELKDSPYTSVYLWIRVNHIHDNNLLIVTHGHGPDRGECYYQAKTYDEFWDIVRKIKTMCDDPDGEYEPVTLKQNNQMIGNSYKEWDVEITNK